MDMCDYLGGCHSIFNHSIVRVVVQQNMLKSIDQLYNKADSGGFITLSTDFVFIWAKATESTAHIRA